MNRPDCSCIDSRHCFAKRRQGAEAYCGLLTETYAKDGACPFCKEFRDVTNGVVYPYDPNYGKR